VREDMAKAFRERLSWESTSGTKFLPPKEQSGDSVFPNGMRHLTGVSGGQGSGEPWVMNRSGKYQ
jgi:hypothetical protein